MRDRLLLLHVLILALAALFFLFTMCISIFLVLAVFTTGIFREYAANSMWIALIPSSIFSILFLQKVLGRIYDVLLGYSTADSKINTSQKKSK
jgi:hypothetical protein